MKTTAAQMAGYMLDAETCAAILRRTEDSDRAVMERLVEHAVNKVCLSSVTLAELAYGVEVSRRSAQDRAALNLLLRYVPVLEYPSDAAEHYGEVRMVLELCELRLTAEQMLATAHARSLGMTLVSCSAPELGRVPGLVCVSWWQ